MSTPEKVLGKEAVLELWNTIKKRCSIPTESLTKGEWDSLDINQKNANILYLINDGSDNLYFMYKQQVVSDPTKQDLLKGNNGQLIGIGYDGAATATVYPCNKNLLINPYFTNPVNRNGKETYIITSPYEYTIDKWGAYHSTIQIDPENGIHIISSGNGYKRFNQLFNGTLKAGTILTGSIFARVNQVSGYVIMTFSENLNITGAPYTILTNTNGTYELFSVTYFLSKDSNALNFEAMWALNNAESTCDLNIIAAKLELGPVQTLAHQDENGKWVLNEIPNYAEQYAICEQYSTITGKFVGIQHSNQNILDNAYFIGGGSQQGGGQFPINQRGEKEYAVSRYTIDRWSVHGAAPAKMYLSDSYLSLVAGVNIAFRQKIEKLPNGTYTLSALCDDGLFTGTVNWGGSISVRAVDGEFAILLELFNNFPTFTVRVDSENEEKHIYAVKLELGDQQTLAHKEGDNWVLNDPPPNYALELEKCQRYQLRILGQELNYGGIIGYGIIASNNVARITIPTSVSMRKTPTAVIGNLQDLTNIIIYHIGGAPTGRVTAISSTYRQDNAIVLFLDGEFNNITANTPVLAKINDAFDILFDANL